MAYVKKKQFSIAEVRLALKRGIWPDQRSFDQIRRVWPDERVALCYCIHMVDAKVWDYDGLCLESYGGQPEIIPQSGYTKHNYIVDRHGLVMEWYDECAYFKVKPGVIVLAEYFNCTGELVREYIVGQTGDNPQPPFDFDEHTVLYLPLTTTLAKAA